VVSRPGSARLARPLALERVTRVAARFSRLRARDIACLAGLVGGGVFSVILRFAMPSLLKDHPVLLESLYGSVIAIITGGAYAHTGRVSLPLVVVAPLAVVAIYDVFAWWAGRLWGSRIIDLYTAQRSQRSQRRAQRAEEWIRRRGVVALAVAYVLPVPNFLIYLMCGSSGMSLWVFLIGDALGTLLWSGLLTGLGWEAGHSAIPVVNAINHYALFVTLGLVAVGVVVSSRRVPRTRTRGAVDPGDVRSSARHGCPRTGARAPGGAVGSRSTETVREG
jgi:membrane-associated protein